MYDPLAAAGGAGGGATGAGLGSLGRSPFLDLLKPLDYPRQALWNMVRGPARMMQGEGSLDDLLGMVPGLAGAGMAALGPLGMLGGALAGGAVQGLGKLTGSDAFEAATPQDITGSDDFLPNLAVGAATDPLTYTGFGLGSHAGGLAGSRMAMRAAEPALAEGPEGILQGFRMGMPQAGFERDAAVSGLSGRNQALGQAVGDVAQTLESRPQALASQVQQQLRPPELPSSPLEAPGYSAIPEAPRNAEQVFEQMLPAAAKEQRIRRAIAGDRNELPPRFEGLSPDQMSTYGRLPTQALAGPMMGDISPAFVGASPEDIAQFRRHAATQRALNTTWQQLEQHGPLAAELARSGQLGPIESRLQYNWSSLGDMMQEGNLSQQELLRHARTAQLEDEAFRTLFERPAEGGPQHWAGQQAIMDQLLGEIGQAHESLQGVNATGIRNALQEGMGYTEGGLLYGNPVTPQQVEQARLAADLTDSLRRGVAQHIEQQVAPLESELEGGGNLPAGRFNALDDQRHALRQQQSAVLRGGHPDPNFWAPGAPVPPTGPPAFQGGSVGQLGGGPAFPPLPEILSQAQAQLGRPLQPWEVQELEQALMQRNPAPLQERGLLQEPGPGMFAGNPLYPSQPYAALGGQGPGAYTLPTEQLSSAYEGAQAAGPPLAQGHPLENMDFTANPYTGTGGNPYAHLPSPPVPPPPPASPLPRGLHTGEPLLDWAPPRVRGVSLETQTEQPYTAGFDSRVADMMGFHGEMASLSGLRWTPEEALAEAQARLGRPLTTEEANVIQASYHSSAQWPDALSRAAEFGQASFPGSASGSLRLALRELPQGTYPGSVVGIRRLERALGRELTPEELRYVGTL